MKPHRGRVVQVESLVEFDIRIAAGTTHLDGWRLHGVDLTDRTDVLARVGMAGATFLGCTFAAGVGDLVEQRGGLVLPTIPESPVDTYRGSLYTAAELYDAPAYADSFDARAFAWSTSTDPDDVLARALHDHAIDEALAAWIRGRPVVGVMGGHAIRRGQPAYADAARLGQLIGASAVVATGGGPGAMEAANLGAWLSCEPPAALDDALAALAAVPSFTPSVQEWAASASAVRTRHPGSPEQSLGIPTWHYGHEPPNVFAGGIAKYFRNAVREATLLEVCNRGIVFLPGAGGTVQEVFQDAAENYYADESAVAPMVLVGAAYWTDTLPVWPLLDTLARGRAMAPHVHLVDSVAEAASLLTPPGAFTRSGADGRSEPRPRRDSGSPTPR